MNNRQSVSTTSTVEFQRTSRTYASCSASNVLHHNMSTIPSFSALAPHGVMTTYIDYAVGHVTSEVSALLAGYISNVTSAMMQPFNEKIFIVPST